jgi:hypothetical protein
MSLEIRNNIRPKHFKLDFMSYIGSSGNFTMP